MTDLNDLLEQYKTSLADLKQNSKPMISVLTMLAEESIIVAEGIVQLIESRLFKVPADQKLCFLYLIDSVCKNVGRDYKNLFQKNLMKSFCHVFEAGNEKVRSNLFKLRSTWKELFSQTFLYQLDVQVKKLDPAWPVFAEIESTQSNQSDSDSPKLIHVNPNFKRNLEEKKDIRKIKFQKFNGPTNEQLTTTSLPKVSNKRPLARQSVSPERKRSPSQWENNNQVTRELNNLINDLTGSNDQFVNNQSDNLYSKQHFPSLSIPGLDIEQQSSAHNLISSANLASNHLPLASSHQISSIQPTLVQSSASTTPLNFLTTSTSLPPTTASVATNVPSGLSQPHFNNLNVLNDFPAFNNHLSTPQDVDYRIPTNQPSVAPLAPTTDSIYNTLSNFNLINAQHLNSFAPAELKLQVNGEIRKLFYLSDHVALVLMNCSVDLPFEHIRHISPIELQPRLINFDGNLVNVYIDEQDTIPLLFNHQWKVFFRNGCEQKIKLGGPAREIYLNNQIIQAKFGGPCVPCKLNGDLADHTLRLGLPAPNVKLSEQPCIDLWIQFLQKYPPPGQQSQMNNSDVLNNTLAIGNPLAMQTQPANSFTTDIINQQQNSVRAISSQIIHQAPIPMVRQPSLAPFMMPTPENHSFFSTSNSIPLINDQQSIVNQSNQKFMNNNHNNNDQQNSDAQNSMDSEQRYSPPGTKPKGATKSNLKGNKSNRNRRSKKDESREPVLELKSESLKIRRQSLIDSIYSGAQCTNCSLRFDNKTKEGKSKYSAHLDWHFRQNRKTRDNNFKTSNLNREWYLPLELWVKYTEINLEDSNDKNQNGLSFDNMSHQLPLDNNQEQLPVPLIKANVDDSLNVCSVCYERFEQVWCDDEEEWKLQNAVLNDDDKYYHPTCLTDLMNKSIQDDSTMKGEETILRISDSILENFEPTLQENNEDASACGKQMESLEIKQERSVTPEKSPSRTDMDQIDIDQSIKEELMKELNEDYNSEEAQAQQESQIDQNALVKKTVLNVFEMENTEAEVNESIDEESIRKESNATDQMITEESSVEQDLKVEIIGLNIVKSENESDELTRDVPAIDESRPETVVKKIELGNQPNFKKDSKPILLKLNMKDSNLDLMNINQRKSEPQVISPKNELSSKTSNNDQANRINGNLSRDTIVYRGREESALCSIM